MAGNIYPEENPAYLSHILQWARAAQRIFLCWDAGVDSSFVGVEDEISDGPEPGLWLVLQQHFGQQAHLCTQSPSHHCHHIATPP